MINRAIPLPITHPCRMLAVSRSSYYYQPVALPQADRELLRRIDEIHLKFPFYGSRRLRDALQDQAQNVRDEEYNGWN